MNLLPRHSWLCFCTIMFWALGASAETKLEKQALSVLEYPDTSNLNVLKGPQGPELIKFLRSIANSSVQNIGTASIPPSEADTVLLRFGDDYSIYRAVLSYQTYYEDRRGGQWANLIERSRQPKFIPYLMGDAFSEEKIKGKFIGNGFDGESIEPRSTFSSVIACRIILSSHAFSSETTLWAKKMEREASSIQYRGEMRRWWNANKSAFLREDYLAVKPGETYVKNEPLPSPSEAPPEPAFGKLTPASTPLPSLTPMTKPVAPVSGFPVMTTVVLLAVSVLAMAVYFFSKKK